MNNFAVSAALLFVGKSLILGLRVFSLLAMARYGQSSLVFASISFALAAAEVGRMLADWGTETWSVRAVALAGSAEERSRAVSGALTVKLLGSLPVCIALVLVCVAKFPIDGLVIGACAAIMLVAGQFSGIAIAYLQAMNRLVRLRVLLLPTIATALIVATVLIVSHDSLRTLAFLAAGECWAAAALTRVLLSERVLQRRSLTASAAGPIFRECIPVAVLSVVVSVYSRLDTFMLSQWSLGALAVYTVAQRMFQPFQAAATSLGATAYARMAQLLRADGGRDGEAAVSLWRSDLLLVGGIAFALSAVLWIVGTLLIGAFLPEYTASQPVLHLLALVVIVTAFNSIATGVLLAHAKSGAVLSIALFELVCSIAGMSILIPRWGALGAALALLLAECANAAVQYPTAWYVWKRGRAAAATASTREGSSSDSASRTRFGYGDRTSSGR